MPPTAGIKVTVGGKVRRMRWTNLSFVELEEVTGRTLDEHQGRAQVGSLAAMNAIVWGALRAEDPSLKLRDLVELVKPQEVAGLYASAVEAAAVALGNTEAAAKIREAVEAENAANGGNGDAQPES